MLVPEYDEDSVQELYKKVMEEFDSKHSAFGVVWEILKGVKIGADLTRVQAPIFTVNPQSILERVALYITPNDNFISAWKSDDEATRFVGFIWNLVANWSFPIKKGISGSKPFNPILGEQFYCHWDNEDTSTCFIAEQVSHHPPITAFSMENDGIGLKAAGWMRNGASFKGTHLMINLSDSVFRFENTKTGDKYTYNAPDLCIDNILWGSPNVYVYGPLHVDGGKYKATLEFNKNYAVKGTISCGKDKIHTIEGDLSDKVYLETKGKKDVWFSKKDNPQKKIKLGDSKGFHDMHSRKMWREVTYHMINGDMDNAQTEKVMIEEAERTKRAEREKNGIEWIPQHFEQHEELGWTLKNK